MPTAVSESASAQPAGQERPDWRAPGKPRRFSWQLLRNRNFRYYFLGSLASNLGTWLQNTVQVLLAYQLTHSVFTVGLVVSAQFVGMVVLSPWAAVLADRIGIKPILVSTQCASTFIAGLMAWRYHQGLLDEHTLIVGALGLGLAFSLALPVQTALVPTLVDPPDTEAAMAMNSVSYNAGRALAPALCVLVLAFIGPTWIFGLNAVSFALFAFVLARLKPDVGRNASDDSSTGGVKPRRAHVMDGLKAARRYRRILLLLAVVAAVTFADDPILVLSPGLVRTTLHVSRNWAGYFIAALGWGTVIGSLSPTMRRKAFDRSRRSRMSRWAACWLLVLTVSVVVFTVGISAPVSLAAAFVAGAAALFTGAAAQALIVGDHPNNAASVAALWAIAWAGTKPFASLLDGGLASHLGFVRTAIILTTPAVLLALGELVLPKGARQYIKNWSLSGYLGFLRTTASLAGPAVLLALGELMLPNKARQYIKDWWLNGLPGTHRLLKWVVFLPNLLPGSLVEDPARSRSGGDHTY